MSFIQNFFTSRDNNANGANYVGQQDRIWWNPDTNAFYYSDGNTPGGILISTGGGGNGVPGGPANSIQINAGNGSFTGSSNLTFNGTVVSIVGNVSANYFIGDGSQLTNLPIQPGTYGNANVADYLPTYTGDFSANNISIGTLYSPNFYSNAVAFANATGTLVNSSLFKYNPGTEVLTVGSISTTGNVSSNFFIGDGSQLTNLPIQPGTYSNANVDNYLPVYTGNISANFICATGNVVASGGNTIIDDGISTTGNIVGANISAQGNVVAGNVLTNNYLYSNGDSIFANIILTGNIDLGNLYVEDQTIGGKNINGNITLLPEGDGWVNTPKISINGLTIANTGGTIEFTTPNGIDLQFTPGALGNILTAGNVVPTANNIATLGSTDHRYTDLWLGAGNLNLIDQTLNQNRQIYADNGNLIFANSDGIKFGDFEIFGNTISTTNPNANIIIGLLSSNAYVEMNRPLTVNSSGGGGIAFQVERSGLTQINAFSGIPANSPGALNIVASSDGAYQNVTNSGGLLHLTGPANSAARITVDAFGTSNGAGVPSTIVLRSARGTANIPDVTVANDTLGRISSVGWGNTAGFGAGAGLAATAIEFVALENFTPTTQGTKITFNTANTGSNSRSISATIQANGVSFANNTIANSGITFTDGSFQNTAFQPTSVVGSVSGATGISIAPTNTSATGNITVTNTGVITVAGTVNQIFTGGANVIAPANGAVTLSLPQDIATSSSPTFNTLTVNDLIILGNVSNVIPSVVSGKVVYVANTATQLSDINTSGLITGNAANGFYAGILYSTTGPYANTWDMTIGNSEGVYAGNLYSDAGLFENIVHVGYANADPAKTYPNASLQADCDTDGYNQIVIQNHNQGANASGDFVAVANNGDDSNFYIDMGINSNAYNNTDYIITKPNDGYLYVNGGNLVIGTQTSGKYINFFTGGTNSTSYIRGTLYDTGLSIVGNVTANNLIGNRITSTDGISAAGNITGVYLFGTSGVSTTGNVTSQNVNTGILSATGNVVAGNIRSGNISATGNITATYLITANTIIDSGISTSGTVTAQGITATVISATSNITGTTINAITQLISPLICVTGNITGGNLLTNGLISTTGNATFGNVQTTGRLVVTGNIDAGNLRTANAVIATTISATGNVTASYYQGNGYYLTGLNAYQTVAANGVNLLATNTSGVLTLTPGNNIIITGNASTDTVILAVSDSPSFTGNIVGGNIRTTGVVTATGNIITAGYFVGDGGFISNISASIGTKIVNGTSYANIAVANGNLVTVIGGATVQTITSTGANITGYANITGNTTTANLSVTGITNLNSNANVKISGGTTGQQLTTDGSGNLYWSLAQAGNTIIQSAANTTINIDFTTNSLHLLYLPTANVTVTLSNYTTGAQARVIVRYGATPYTIALGVGNVQQTTEGATTIPISGAGGHKIQGNQSVQLLYTCFDNTAGNCYVASTFL